MPFAVLSEEDLAKSKIKALRGWVKEEIKRVKCGSWILEVQEKQTGVFIVIRANSQDPSQFPGDSVGNGVTLVDDEIGILKARHPMALVGIAYNLILQTVLHEFHEWFTVDGVRVMNPHFSGYTKLD